MRWRGARPTGHEDGIDCQMKGPRGGSHSGDPGGWKWADMPLPLTAVRQGQVRTWFTALTTAFSEAAVILGSMPTPQT